MSTAQAAPAAVAERKSASRRRDNEGRSLEWHPPVPRSRRRGPTVTPTRAAADALALGAADAFAARRVVTRR